MKRLVLLVLTWLMIAAPCLGADLTMAVDTAVTVPVNVLPLIDDTDFKARETSVAYNATGMDLTWNFVTTAGVVSSTAVTPTTSGVHDWTVAGAAGDAMYKIEIPDSGGTINNDAEGVGWFTGVATGILPWRGPTIEFVPANIADAMINGSDELQVDVAKFLGTAPTEGGAGRLAGGITKFFDVASPTGTVNSLPDAVPGAAGGGLISGSNAGTTTLGALTIAGATTYTGTTLFNGEIIGLPVPNFVLRTTVSSVGSQTVLEIANFPSGTINGYKDYNALLIDASSFVPRLASVRRIVSDDGSNQIVLNAPADFTVVEGDVVELYAPDLETLTRMPDATAGTSGGLFIAATNAATTVDITGSLSGSVGSVASGVTLADDAITAGKFDGSTAFPVTQADTGATAIARTGADADTLKSLSDQLDGVATNATTAATQSTTAATQSTTAATQATTAATQATTAAGNTTTILNRLGAWTGSGRNTLLGAVQAMFRKDSDATVPSDVNVNLGGGAGTASNATDSLEAQRDNLDALVNGAPTFAQAMSDHGYTTARAEKIDKLAPSLLVNTTISALTNQTTFTLAAGPPDDDALNGALILVTDETDSTQKAVGLVKKYVGGSSRTVTLVADPSVFMMANGDEVDVIAGGSPIPLWLASP